jgi:hypothetical protein
MHPPAETYAGEQTSIGRQKPFADVLAFVRVPAFDCRPSRCACFASLRLHRATPSAKDGPVRLNILSKWMFGVLQAGL